MNDKEQTQDIIVENSSGNGIAGTLDASYHFGQGARGGSNASSSVFCFQNTGRGWWNEGEIAEALRTPCGGDSTKSNLALFVTDY